MKSYTIHLIRNAPTTGNLEGRYVGHTDEDIDEELAEELKQLSRDYVYPPIDALFTSPLKRCRHTAEILYPENSPLVIDDFIELDFGEFENKTAEELKDNEDFAEWFAGGPDASPPYGESNGHFAKRICAAFEKTVDGLMKTGTHRAAIVTHGGVIMSILAAYGLPELPMTSWTCAGGCGFTIRLDAQLWMTGRKFEVFSEFPYEREILPD